MKPLKRRLTQKDFEMTPCGVVRYKHNPMCPTCYPDKIEKRKKAIEIFKELYGGSNDSKRS